MTVTQEQIDALAAQLQVLTDQAAADAAAPVAVAAAAPATAPKRMTRAQKAGKKPGPRPDGSAGHTKATVAYGVAPTIKGNAAGTQAAREAALEIVLPGINQVAYIYPVGENALAGKPGQDKYTKAVSQMTGTPWTWIELPGGKDFTINGLDADQVREQLKKTGYGYSASNKLWCCKSSGEPGGGRRGGYYRAQGVGKTMLGTDE